MAMSRDELQDQAVSQLEEHKRLLCEWATGTGKSGVVLKFLRKHPGSKTLILVPETNNIQNWDTEFTKFGVSRDGVEIVCYASFHKHRDSNWDLVVFDEAPHIDTEKRREICSSVTGEHIVALGAVIDYDERQALQNAYGNFFISWVPLKRAIEWNILPSPKVYILHMQMDEVIPRHYYNGKKITDAQMYDVLQEKVRQTTDAYDKQSTEQNKNRMLRAGSARKRFLGNLKTWAIAKVCHALRKKNRRFLCFCVSIDQANLLGGENAFTSKTPASKKVLDRFNNHEIDSLYVVGKLIEGQNLCDIECGVIGQLGGTRRISVQECGRIMRSNNPVIYIPIFDGTKDEDFLGSIISDIPTRYIKHYDF